MRLIVGLGNPGREYEQTRHNLGFRVVQAFAEGIRISRKQFHSLWGEGPFGGEKVGFLLPQTYMNRSGEAVSEAVRFFGLPPEDLLVVHDDIDLALGRVKLDFDAGAAGHRGVASVTESLGTRQYHRLRLGIGRPAPREEVEPYVLEPFGENQEEEVSKMMSESIHKISDWLGVK